MTDPAVQAAYAAAFPGLPPGMTAEEAERRITAAVDAYRRHVRASRPDAERVTWWHGVLSGLVGRAHPVDREGLTIVVEAVFAALADETAARLTAEADRDRGLAKSD